MHLFQEVGDGIFRRRYESLDLNIGVVIGEAGMLVIDTRASHVQADELRAELAVLGPSPVVAVVNSHFHWDHVWGNARFEGVPIWGHRRCREVLVEEGEAMRSRVLASMPDEYHEQIREVVSVPPDRTFEALAVIDLGGRRVTVSHHGRGHTDSDVVVTVDDVCFMGDLIEEGAPPAFGDAFPAEWPLTLEAIEPDLPHVIVPGHGDVVDPAFVASQQEELAAVADALAAAHAAGRPLNDPPPGPYPPETMELAYRAFARR